jgi:fatty-acyl-CoA synthase
MAQQAVYPPGITRDITIGQILDRVVESHPDREAIVCGDGRKTWRTYRDDALELAVQLHRLGIGPGQRVGVWSVNRYEWAVAWMALPKLGAIFVPLDSWYKTKEAHYILAHSEVTAVILAEEYVEMARTAPGVPNLKYIISMDGGAGCEDPRCTTLAELRATPPTAQEIEDVMTVQAGVGLDDSTCILYTSGTTGEPKGAELTHRNLVGNAIDSAEAMRTDETDVFLVPVPFSHCFGCVLGITLSATTASKMVVIGSPDPELSLRTIEKERCTVLYGTPTHFMRYIRFIRTHPDIDVSSGRTGIIGGAPCPPDTVKGIFEDLTANELCIAYGLTEASPLVCICRIDDPPEKRLYTVGKAFPTQESRVVNENNEPVDPNVEGEFVTRGYHVMKGYFKSPDTTAKAIDAEGWLHTGDLATVDEDGYYKIVGRIKDMIIYGGFNVYPAVVENFLVEHPRIHEAALVGLPDPEYGELVACAANVDPGFTEQELVDYCYGTISDPSVPRFVTFEVQLPTSGRGKIQKFKLRETLEEMRATGALKKVVPTQVRERKRTT